MADTKISALTAATTPLAGTEVLPIVQSGTTKKVSVANLTAGRAVSMLSGTITDNIATPVPLNINNNSASTAAGTRINWQYNGSTVGYVGNQFDGADFNNLYNSNRFHIFSIGSTEYFRITNPDVTLSAGNLIQGTAAKGVNFTANTPAAGMTSQLLNWYEEGTFTPSITSGATGVSYTTQSGHYTRLGNMVFFRLNLVMSAATANGSAFKVGGLPFTCGQSGGGSFAYDNGAWTGSATTNMPMVFVGAGGTEVTFFQGSGAQVVGTDLVSIGSDNFYIVGQYMV